MNVYRDVMKMALLMNSVGLEKMIMFSDHLYTLSSLIRYRLSENKSTYTCFIDI